MLGAQWRQYLAAVFGPSRPIQLQLPRPPRPGSVWLDPARPPPRPIVISMRRGISDIRVNTGSLLGADRPTSALCQHRGAGGRCLTDARNGIMSARPLLCEAYSLRMSSSRDSVKLCWLDFVSSCLPCKSGSLNQV